MNSVNYLRVEDGPIEDLGVCIVTEFYRLERDTEVGLLVAGFDYEPDRNIKESIDFVRKSAVEFGLLAETERVEAVLRLISGKTVSNEGGGTVASVEFGTPRECATLIHSPTYDRRLKPLGKIQRAQLGSFKRAPTQCARMIAIWRSGVMG